jgi:hypothetical protein
VIVCEIAPHMPETKRRAANIVSDIVMAEPPRPKGMRSKSRAAERRCDRVGPSRPSAHFAAIANF